MIVLWILVPDQWTFGWKDLYCALREWGLKSVLLQAAEGLVFTTTITDSLGKCLCDPFSIFQGKSVCLVISALNYKKQHNRNISFPNTRRWFTWQKRFSVDGKQLHQFVACERIELLIPLRRTLRLNYIRFREHFKQKSAEVPSNIFLFMKKTFSNGDGRNILQERWETIDLCSTLHYLLFKIQPLIVQLSTCISQALPFGKLLVLKFRAIQEETKGVI